MTCICEDCIARPSDNCPVHGSVLLADRANWFWLDDDRDPDSGDWSGPWVAAFVVVGLIVGAVAAILAPIRFVRDCFRGRQ